MNKIELKCGFSSLRAISLFLGISLLSACAVDDMKTSGKTEGRGFVALDLKADTAYSITKAVADPEDVNSYHVAIRQGTEVITSFLFGDKPEILALDAGEYTAQATWGTLVPAAFDSLYVEGVTNFSVKDGETTPVKFDCRPANAKVTVDYADDLKKAYSNYTVSMATSHTGNSPLVYTKDETRAGYFQVNTEGEKLNLKMVFSTSSKDYKSTKSVDILPRDLVRLHFKLGSNSGGNNPDTLNPTPPPTLVVNVAGLLFEANKNLTQSVSVTSNSEWTIVNPANWLTVEKQNGKAVFVAKENTTDQTRKTTVTLTASNANKYLSTNIEVFQQGKSSEGNAPDLSVDIVELIVPSDAFQHTITVRSTNGWSYTNDAEEWLNVSRTEGNDGTLTLSADANSTDKVRNAEIVLTATGEAGKTTTVTIRIEQQAKDEDPYISVDFSNLVLPYTGISSQPYTVETNQDDWSVSSSADWLKAEKREGAMVLTVEPNQQNEVRSAELILTATQGIRSMTVKITVTQEAKPLDVPPLKIVVTIDRTFGKEETLEYTIDNLYSIDRNFIFKLLDVKETYEYKVGTSPNNFYLNITGTNGAKIQNCSWTYYGTTVDLTDSSTQGAKELKSQGLIWDENLKDQSLATIYLDKFIKNLSVGFYEYQLKVSGVGDDGYAYSNTILLKIKITN